MEGIWTQKWYKRGMNIKMWTNVNNMENNIKINMKWKYTEIKII